MKYGTYKLDTILVVKATAFGGAVATVIAVSCLPLFFGKEAICASTEAMGSTEMPKLATTPRTPS